uniref:Claudin n=1 Tax=Varanus komodoensis TaxID=61221 RepID=A0A8D2L1Q8_VARKO
MACHSRTTAQLGGFVLSLFGWVSSCVTTFIPLWKSLNLELSVFENWNVGLWHACIFQEEGKMQCKAYDSILALPLDIQVSRIIMVTSNGLGLLAFSLSIWGLNCLKTRAQNQGLKRPFGIVGGALFCISGIASLVPVSWVAHTIVEEFWDETVPPIVSKWEFGEALFLGWFAGFCLILGGLLLIYKCCTAASVNAVILTSSRKNISSCLLGKDKQQQF